MFTVAGIQWTLPEDVEMEECSCIWIGSGNSKVLFHLSLQFSKCAWVLLNPATMEAEVIGAPACVTLLQPVFSMFYFTLLGLPGNGQSNYNAKYLKFFFTDWSSHPNIATPAQKIFPCGESQKFTADRDIGELMTISIFTSRGTIIVCYRWWVHYFRSSSKECCVLLQVSTLAVGGFLSVVKRSGLF